MAGRPPPVVMDTTDFSTRPTPLKRHLDTSPHQSEDPAKKLSVRASSSADSWDSDISDLVTDSPRPPATALDLPTDDDDGFTVVTNKRKRQAKPLLPRPHPALLVQRASASRPLISPDAVTLLFRPTNHGQSLHKLSQRALSAAYKSLRINPLAVRMIRQGGLAMDFPHNSELSSILNVTEFGSIEVSVSRPNVVKGCKGTIIANFADSDELFDIYGEHESNPALLSAQRIGSTNKWILTFDQDSLPERVVINFCSYAVSPFFKQPLQCFKCKRFGHVAELCRGAMHCGKCGSRDHETKACPSELSWCVNCGHSHEAKFKQCSHRIFNLRVEKVIATDGCSRQEASVKIAASTSLPTKKAPVKRPLLPKPKPAVIDLVDSPDLDVPSVSHAPLCNEVTFASVVTGQPLQERQRPQPVPAATAACPASRNDRPKRQSSSTGNSASTSSVMCLLVFLVKYLEKLDAPELDLLEAIQKCVNTLIAITRNGSSSASEI